MTRLHLLAVLFSLLRLGALAQTGPAGLTVAGIDVQGSFRSRLEAWDWFEAAGNDSYAFSGNILRLGLGQRQDRFDWQVELALPFLLGLPNNAIAPPPQGQLGLGATYFAANDGSVNAANFFPKQAFVRLKGMAGGGGSLRLGRFEFIEGTEVMPANASLAAVKRDRIAQRLIGNFGWSHVGRSFDGAHYAWGRPGLNLTIVGALPTRGVFQVNGWRNLNVATFYGAVTGQTGSPDSAGEWRLFGIYYEDWRDLVKTDNRPALLRATDLGSVRIGSFGGHYLQAFPTDAGPLDGMAWAVGQVGAWGRLDHRAWAAALEAGWQPDGLPRLRPWLRVGYWYGSGDEDPLDDRHQTFFQILPTPRPYARFPFYNLMNSRDLFVSLALRPRRDLTLKSEVHRLRLANRNDLWYAGGGAFQPGTFGYLGRTSGGRTGLATLLDLSADYELTSQLTVTAYFGHANGRPVIQAIYPAGKNGNFAYVEAAFRF